MPAPFSPQSMALATLETKVATPLREFYTFLSTLPYLQLEDVLEPPAGGWSTITAARFAPHRFNSTVMELLRHLPHIRQDGPNDIYELGPATFPCDYRRDCLFGWEIPDMTERDNKFPDWVVPLTYGKAGGNCYMLDTTDGTVFVYQPQTIYDPVFEADDPRAWRNECARAGDTVHLGDLLEEWKEQYAQLHWISFPSVHAGDLWCTRSRDNFKEEHNELREIMLRYGWPYPFDRESCRNALKEWERRKLETFREEQRAKRERRLAESAGST